jgi:formylglycine-generating enzyme required for sulfatase activity
MESTRDKRELEPVWISSIIVVIIVGLGLVAIFLWHYLHEKPGGETFTNSIGMKFILIPAGEFWMGPKEETGRKSGVIRHKVGITKSFYMQTTEVTQAQWKAVMGMGNNPSNYSGDNLPVESVSWNDAQEFIKKLNEKEKLAGWTYRLPTEAEWEYACRDGSTTRFCFGDNECGLDNYCWFYENSDIKTHPVGTKKPNKWGLYDMHGNVWEWCADWYGDYASSPVSDPKGPASGTSRVLRGGCWINCALNCRSAARFGVNPAPRNAIIGFRVVCSSGR